MEITRGCVRFGELPSVQYVQSEDVFRVVQIVAGIGHARGMGQCVQEGVARIRDEVISARSDTDAVLGFG